MEQLRRNANLRHESAEDWYDSLGYHVDTDEGSVCHPVCDLSEVDDYEPQDDAEQQLLEYAREAADTAHAVESALEDAVEAYRAGDLQRVLEALDEARSLESEYGDSPASDELRGRLLVRATKEEGDD